MESTTNKVNRTEGRDVLYAATGVLHTEINGYNDSAAFAKALQEWLARWRAAA